MMLARLGGRSSELTCPTPSRVSSRPCGFLAALTELRVEIHASRRNNPMPAIISPETLPDHRAGDLSCTFERNSPPRRPDNVLPKLPRAVPRSPLFPAFKEPGAAQRYEIVRVPTTGPSRRSRTSRLPRRPPVARTVRPSALPSAPFPVMPTALRAVLDPSAGAAAVGRAGGRPRARAACRLLRPSHHPSSVRVSQSASERASEQRSGSPCVLT